MSMVNYAQLMHEEYNTRTPATSIESSTLDSDWMTRGFMLDGDTLNEKDRKNRFFNSADRKFTDSTIGGNIAINTKPQYCRYADPRRPGRRFDREKVSVNNYSSNHGWGHYYSRAHDDNAQNLYLEFGVPQFSSLFGFMARAVDRPTSIMANTARSPVPYDAAKFIGAAVVFVAFPLLSIAVYTLGFLKKILFGETTEMYYSLKPAMHMYWGTVSTIATSISTELGVLTPSLLKSEPNKIGSAVEIDQEELDDLRELYPEIFTKSNYIDVYAMAARTQILLNDQITKERELTKKGIITRDEYYGYVQEKVVKKTPGTYDNMLNEILSIGGIFSFLDPKDSPKEPETTGSEEELKSYQEKDELGRYKATKSEIEGKVTKSTGAYFDAVNRGGGRYAIFQVEHVGTVTDTFSNEIGEIPLKEKMNSMGGAARDIRFNLAGGNLVGETIKDIATTASDVVMGYLDGATFGLSNVLQALLGGGYIDMPKMWKDSNATIAKHTYKIPLHSVYGHPIAHLQQFYIPLSMMLAGALPLSTGKSSYTSPMLCSAYLRGIQNIRLGMITNLSITRGTTNLGFNPTNGRALGFEVTMEITDFSNIIAAPVNSGVLGAFNLSLDDNNLLNNYLSTLAGRDLHTDRFMMPKAKMRLSKMLMGLETYESPAYWGQKLNSWFGGPIEGVLDDYSVTRLQQS